MKRYTNNSGTFYYGDNLLVMQALLNGDEAILKYKELEKTGELPTVQERIYYRADGLDSEYILANMRKKWKKDNM